MEYNKDVIQILFRMDIVNMFKGSCAWRRSIKDFVFEQLTFIENENGKKFDGMQFIDFTLKRIY